LRLHPIAALPRLRVLAWDGKILYASRGYTLLTTNVDHLPLAWISVARYRPTWWRNLTAASRLSFRLVRDGFHALALLPSGDLVAALPGAIATLAPGKCEFRIAHRVLRGTRPLHFAVTPQGRVFWGEYFDNRERDAVHIYGSTDLGQTWHVAHTFPRGVMRHVHNIVYDRWADCLWVLTGDEGQECRILRASCDFKTVEPLLSGHQQARAVALVPAEDGLYFASDTPLEANHIYRLDRAGNLTARADITSSCLYGCRTANALFFSTMVEPSAVNRDRCVRLFASSDGQAWGSLQQWQKDPWPMGPFQYGNAILPDGENSTNVLALTTIAVRGADLHTTLWSVD
jgi:hypothetical protein